jgi:hypothetical protein
MMSRRNESGDIPRWLVKLRNWTFTRMWKMHDGLFSKVFGRGDIVSEEDGVMKG